MDNSVPRDVNDHFVIAENDRMVSINSAIEIDLTGQVCSDSIGSRLYRGVGGQVDFRSGHHTQSRALCSDRTWRGRSVCKDNSPACQGTD